METINLYQHSRIRQDQQEGEGDLIGWLIIHAITKMQNCDEIYRGTDGDIDPSEMKIEFKINGIEVPFVKAMKDIEAEFDRMVNKQAYDIVKGKFIDLDEKLYLISDAFRDILDNIKKDFNLVDED